VILAAAALLAQVGFRPRDMAAIEKVMKEEGLLERYARAD
jgi:hypothetical protein